MNFYDYEQSLGFLENNIGVVLGVELLEYYDKNHLSGDNATRSKEKITELEQALVYIRELKYRLSDLKPITKSE